MVKLKVFLGVTILVLLVLLPVGCGRPATPEGPEDARDEVLGYLRENVRGVVESRCRCGMTP